MGKNSFLSRKANKGLGGGKKIPKKDFPKAQNPPGAPKKKKSWEIALISGGPKKGQRNGGGPP